MISLALPSTRPKRLPNGDWGRGAAPTAKHGLRKGRVARPFLATLLVSV
jgi:hypothetical protein